MSRSGDLAFFREGPVKNQVAGPSTDRFMSPLVPIRAGHLDPGKALARMNFSCGLTKTRKSPGAHFQGCEMPFRLLGASARSALGRRMPGERTTPPQNAAQSSSATASEPLPAGGPKKLRIAVIPKGTTHEFWKSVARRRGQRGQGTGRRRGSVEGLAAGKRSRDANPGDARLHHHARSTAFASPPTIRRPSSNTSTRPSQAKIPVVIFDSGLDDQSKIVSYVATDNYQGGALAARRMAEVLHGKGNVILCGITREAKARKDARPVFSIRSKKSSHDPQGHLVRPIFWNDSRRFARQGHADPQQVQERGQRDICRLRAERDRHVRRS